MGVELTLLEQARKLIYESEDVSQDLETIRELLREEEDDTIKTLVQAEAAIKAGLTERAKKLLKGYKKVKPTDNSVIRAMNKALQMVENKKVIYDPIKWREIHEVYEKMKEKIEISTDDNER